MLKQEAAQIEFTLRKLRNPIKLKLPPQVTAKTVPVAGVVPETSKDPKVATATSKDPKVATETLKDPKVVAKTTTKETLKGSSSSATEVTGKK